MKCLEVIGPIGLVIRGEDVYQYYKGERDILVQEKLKKRIRIFVEPEEKEKVLEELKKLGFQEFNVLDDVIYVGDRVCKVSLVSIPIENEKKEDFKLRLKTIHGIVGVEDSVSNFRKQEYLISKMEEGNFSRRLGYFLKAKLFVEEGEEKLVVSDILQEKPTTRKEISNQLEILRKKLILSTVDYETFHNQIVMATVMRNDGFSKTLIVNKNPELVKEFEKILEKYKIKIEIVPDEKTLIKKVYEYRMDADIEMIHGSSILEKQKDHLEFPSTRGRPKDKFGVMIYFKPVPPIQVVTSEGLIPSCDSLYTCKHEKHPTKRSLEDLLEYYFGDKETLKKTDYKNFGIYLKLENAEDFERFKNDVEKTIIHNVQDAVAHLKLNEFLLFDQGFLVLPMLFSIDIETIFKKTMEEIGEAILTSELVQNKIFPKMRNDCTKFSKKKEKIISNYDRVLTKRYGERIEGRWIYPSLGFVPEIILENEKNFQPYILKTFKKFFEMKEGLGVFGVDEKGKHVIFDPYSFIINSVSAYLLFGKKTFTSEEISDKLFREFRKIYEDFFKRGKIEGCEIVYLSPFRSRLFIAGEPEKTKKIIERLKEEYPFLLTDYNKHEDIFIPLNRKQALATESGKIVKIGWRGASKLDPEVVKKAIDKIVKKFVSYGLREAKKELEEQMKRIEDLEYPLEDYKIEGKLSKRPEKYKKENFRLELLKKACEEYRKKFGKEPSSFIEFFVTQNGIEFSEKPESKIDVNLYKEYLTEKIKPLLHLFKLEYPSKNSKLTNYI